MFRCEDCGREFAHYETPGKCPLCGIWAKVRCEECGYFGAASFYVQKGNKCPRCGRKAQIPGALVGTRWLLAALVGVVLALMIVIGVIVNGWFSSLGGRP
jgi:hypothetical protein